jgi:hypothetical protein
VVAAALFEHRVGIWHIGTGELVRVIDTSLDFGGRRLAISDDGNLTLKTVYLDSARTTLQQRLKVVPNDAGLASAIGSVLAYLGSCKEAVEFGIRGKELLSIAKCHW